MNFQGLDPYIYQNTYLHKINAKMKTICFIIFLFLSSMTIDVFFSSSLLFISILFLYFSQISFTKLIMKIKYPLIILFAMIFSIILFSTNLCVYNNSNCREIYFGSYILLARSISSLFFIISFFATTKLELITKTMIDFHVPNLIIQVFIFSYRFVFVLINELNMLIQISTIKGFEFKLKIKNLIVLSNLIGILFIKSYEKSDFIYYSMLSKGYSGKINMINYENISMYDYIFLILTLFYLLTYIIYIFKEVL